jgi:hypothetical protein
MLVEGWSSRPFDPSPRRAAAGDGGGAGHGDGPGGARRVRAAGGQILVKQWSNTGQILVTATDRAEHVEYVRVIEYWSNYRRILVKYWSNTGQMLAGCAPAQVNSAQTLAKYQ